MTVIQIHDKYYEGESTDDKPTGVIAGSTFRETDTRALYITHNGDDWVVADLRVRLVGENGDFLALEEQLDDLLTNIAILDHDSHARFRVYPRVAGATITLVSDGVADTFGPWTEIIAEDVIDFMYECQGVVIYGVDVAASYFLQLGYSLTAGDDPTDAQILGEREIKITSAPIAQATEVLEFACPECPANAKLWGRLKTDGGATDEAYITVLISRHVNITNPIAHLATWPWST